MLSSSPVLGGSMLSGSNVLVGNAVRAFGATLPRGFILVMELWMQSALRLLTISEF